MLGRIWDLDEWESIFFLFKIKHYQDQLHSRHKRATFYRYFYKTFWAIKIYFKITSSIDGIWNISLNVNKLKNVSYIIMFNKFRKVRGKPTSISCLHSCKWCYGSKILFLFRIQLQLFSNSFPDPTWTIKLIFILFLSTSWISLTTNITQLLETLKN